MNAVLDALLAAIVANPHGSGLWGVMADCLQENDQPDRADLVRLHRELLDTGASKRGARPQQSLHADIMRLLRSGAEPCLPRRTLTLPGAVELPMVFIPPGSFLMGSVKSEMLRGRGETRHPVTLTRGFWLGVTPVTQRQYQAVTGTNPSQFRGDEFPVEMVSWDDAQAFCRRLRESIDVAARLPSEAEWEYACRAGTRTPFHWGTALNGTQANCRGDMLPYGTRATGPFLQTTTAVGSYVSESPHPWGLADMIGNVMEWCGDRYGKYPRGAVVDPVGPRRVSDRALRGGAWTIPPWLCRAASRFRSSPTLRYGHVGFRLAVDPLGH